MASVAAVVMIIVVIGLSFAPSVWGPFFFDDEHFILKNRFIEQFLIDPQASVSIYRTSVTEGAMISGNFYRPHQQMVFAMAARLVGFEAFWFHVLPIFFHCFNGFLVFLWLRGCFGLSLLASLMGALFFGVHPVQTEAVCYISGLADPLSSFFWLSGILVLVKGLDQTGLKRWMLWFFGEFLVIQGFLTKESSVVVVPFLVLTLVGRRLIKQASRERGLRFIRSALTKDEVLWIGGVGISAGIYVALRFSTLNFNRSGLGVDVQSNPYTENLSMRLVTFINVLWDYAVLIFWPQKLFYEKPYLAYETLWSLRGGFGMGVLLICLGTMYNFPKYPRLAAGLGCFFCALAPYMGWVPLNGIFLEHWLYMPMIGLGLVVASGVDGLLLSKAKVWVRQVTLWTGFVLLFGFALRTFARSQDWARPEDFYLNEIAMSGGSMRMHNNLGMYYADLQQFDLALDHYQKAIDWPGAPPLPQPHHNKARIYLNRGQWDLGIQEIKGALQKDPLFIYSLRLLSQVWEALGQEERRQVVNRAIEAVEKGQSYDTKAFFAKAFP